MSVQKIVHVHTHLVAKVPPDWRRLRRGGRLRLQLHPVDQQRRGQHGWVKERSSGDVKQRPYGGRENGQIRGNKVVVVVGTAGPILSPEKWWIVSYVSS
jgi:hypothetical protein